jgi:hypothetical protein
MPKIDPVTGCTVMTLGECLNGMAEQEGKGRTGGDILSDIYMDMAQADRNLENEIKNDKEGLLNKIQEWVKYDEYEDVDYPVEVLEITDVQHSSNFSGSSTSVTARVRVKNGTERECAYHESYWGGTRLDPPEEDAELEWLDPEEQ